MLKLWVELEFDAAHRLPCHRGKCKNMHGHRYKVQCGFVLRPGEEMHEGIMVDFAELKSRLKEVIDERWDHAFIGTTIDVSTVGVTFPGGRVVSLKDSPTAEVMVCALAEELREATDSLVVELVHMKLYETPGCWVEWMSPWQP